MKTLCTYVLLLAMTLQALHTSFLLAEYRVRLPEYLAKCINRDRSERHCNGQCLLMKKIGEAEKGEAQKNLTPSEHHAFYVHQERMVFTPCLPDEKDEKPFSPYRMAHGCCYSRSVFHPPIA